MAFWQTYSQLNEEMLCSLVHFNAEEKQLLQVSSYFLGSKWP